MDKALLDLFSPITAAGVSEAIVRRIGELIASGELRPGDRLPTETELAEAFAVSAMTVRAALQVLRANNVVETRRGRDGGTFVRPDAVQARYLLDDEPPIRNEFEDFTVWRSAISGEASARLAARFAAGNVPDAERARLNALSGASHEHGLTSDSFRLADAEFHLCIAAMTGSAMLLEGERGIQAHLTRAFRGLMHPSELDVLPGQSHDPLLKAIVEGRPADAREALAIHVQSTVDLMIGLGAFRKE